VKKLLTKEETREAVARLISEYGYIPGLEEMRRITGQTILSAAIYRHFGGMEQIHDEFGLLYQKTTSRKSFAEKCSVKLTPGLSEYLDGLLLGDGSVIFGKGKDKRAGRYSQDFAVRYEEWALKVVADLKKFGIECNIQHRVRSGKIKEWTGDREIVTIISRTYPCLAEVRNRWYPSGIKVVPENIELTPIVMGNWFLGDGSTSWAESRSFKPVVLTFCTNDMSEQDRIILSSKLSVLGIVV